MPVRSIDVADARDDEDHDDRDLQGHHERIDSRRLTHAHVADGTHRSNDQRGRQVENRAGRDDVIVDRRQRRVGQHLRQEDVSALEQVDRVRRPAHGHCGRRHAVFEQQIPADEPGHRLAERGICIAVGAARHRKKRRKLRVAQRRKAASEGSDEERQSDRRPGLIGRHLPGQHEYSRADRRAEPDRRQRPGGQHSLQAAGVGLPRRVRGTHGQQVPQHRTSASPGHGIVVCSVGHTRSFGGLRRVQAMPRVSHSRPHRVHAPGTGLAVPGAVLALSASRVRHKIH